MVTKSSLGEASSWIIYRYPYLRMVAKSSLGMKKKIIYIYIYLNSNHLNILHTKPIKFEKSSQARLIYIWKFQTSDRPVGLPYHELDQMVQIKLFSLRLRIRLDTAYFAENWILKIIKKKYFLVTFH